MNCVYEVEKRSNVAIRWLMSFWVCTRRVGNKPRQRDRSFAIPDISTRCGSVATIPAD